ncbi:MAG: hypothetical protein ACO3YQ_08135 [Flavobacteriales bacterium]
MKYSLSLLLATLAVLWILWTQVHDPRWQGHIVVDPVVYWQRATSFFTHDGSWSGLETNEYQPGALWFFAGIGRMTGAPGEFDPFFKGLLAVNLLLLAGHVLLARFCGPAFAPWLMLLFALLAGPLLLCRFELLVSLLVLGAWALWVRGHLSPAGFLLGAATATKIYPVLLVPFLAASAWRRGGWRNAARGLLWWGAGGFLVVGTLGMWGSEWRAVRAALQFHFDKPFGIEGLLGSGIPLAQWWLGIPLRMAPRNGIYGFESDLGTAVTFLLQWSWVAAAAGIFFLVWRRRCADLWSDPGVLFVLFGWYVVLGKLMAPQYTWWAVPFLALTDSQRLGPRRRVVVILLVAASLLLGQVVYPLNYSEFLEGFNGEYHRNRFFWINVVKNLLWLAAVLAATLALVPRTLRDSRVGG